MGPVIQAASIAAWNDEAHVTENRRLYREKFDRITPLLTEVLDVRPPDAGFYLWAHVRGCCKGSDAVFAQQLYEQYNVTVLPGSFLAREALGHNPGTGRIRMALVANPQECLEAAERIRRFVRNQG
jgi:N-succinyldiaminopimelate aminotransferase